VLVLAATAAFSAAANAQTAPGKAIREQVVTTPVKLKGLSLSAVVVRGGVLGHQLRWGMGKMAH
jgi:hypothetical protein